MTKTNISFRTKRPFTLIEILVVIVIVGILFGIGLPAFEKLAKGQGVELASRNIAAKVKAARAFAVTKRKSVAILFPQSGLPANYLYNSYRTCIVTNVGSGSGDFQQWIPNEKWNFLPSGTGVVEVDQDKDYDKSNDTFTYVDNVNCSSIGGSSDVDGVLAIIFKPSGRMPNLQRYITLDEGAYSGGSFVYTNPTNPGITMIIDPYTGRLSYGTRL